MKVRTGDNDYRLGGGSGGGGQLVQSANLHNSSAGSASCASVKGSIADGSYVVVASGLRRG